MVCGLGWWRFVGVVVLWCCIFADCLKGEGVSEVETEVLRF